MRQFFHSLRFRLMLLVPLVIFPAFLLILNNASEDRRLASVQVEKDALQLAWAISDHHNELVEIGRNSLFLLAQSSILHQDDSEACRKYLASFVASHIYYRNVVKTDLAGNVICDAVGSRSPRKIIFDGFPETIINTKSFTIGNYIISPTTGKPTIGLGYPLLDEDGEVSALLILSLDLTSLERLFSEAQVPTGSILTLRDRNGRILSRYPDPESWIGRSDPDFRDSTDYATQIKEGTVEAIGLDGVSRLYAFTSLRSTPKAELSISVGIPKKIAFAEVNKKLFQNLLALGLVAIVAFAGAWFYSNHFFLQPTRTILATTKKLATGDLSARIGLENEPGELGQLAIAFDNMAAALEQRSAEWMEVHKALKREESERARLLHQLISAHEDERKRIARELHDETSQSLTALMIGLETARLATERNGNNIGQLLQNARSIANGMLNDIHRIIGNLRPSLLDDLGLVPAIAWCGEKLLDPVGVEMDLQADGFENRLPPMVETVAFRIVQEALTNVVRHSGATRTEVKLNLMESVLIIQVVDNGHGYNPAQQTKDQHRGGYGLVSMRERAAILNGDLSIYSTPGEGTQILVRLPLPKEKADYD